MAASNADGGVQNVVPSVSIAVDECLSSSDSIQGQRSSKATNPQVRVNHHAPLTGTVSLGGSLATASTSRPVGPTPLPRTKRGPSKRGGQLDRSKSTPRRNISKINRKGSSQLSDLHRPCLQHSFITEATDVQEMEQGLLHLLDDFHSGKLQAFVKDCSFEKMDKVREQQERLARLHFDLGSQQEAYGTLSEEGQLVAKDHLAKLMTQLQDLSTAIEQLQSSTFIDGHQENQR